MSDDSLMSRLVAWLTRHRAQPLIDQPPTGADAYVAFEPTADPTQAYDEMWHHIHARNAEKIRDAIDKIRRESTDPYIRGELAALQSDLDELVESLTGADLDSDD